MSLTNNWDSFAQTLANDFVTIVVRATKREFVIHKKLLVSIEFFAKALTGSFAEAATGVITLPDEDPQVLEILIVWLYRGIVPAVTSQEKVHTLIDVYLFADKICLSILANKTVDNIVTSFSTYTQAKTSAAMVEHIYNQTIEGSPLRDWVVETFVFDLQTMYNYKGLPIKEARDAIQPLCVKFSEFFHAFFERLRVNNEVGVEYARGDLEDVGCSYHRHTDGIVCYRETDLVVLAWNGAEAEE